MFIPLPFFSPMDAVPGLEINTLLQPTSPTSPTSPTIISSESNNEGDRIPLTSTKTEMVPITIKYYNDNM